MMSRHEQYHQPDKSSISYLIYLEERVAKQDETIEQLEAKLKEADYLIEELDSHEGAEGWSGYLRERLLDYTQAPEEADDG